MMKIKRYGTGDWYLFHLNYSTGHSVPQEGDALQQMYTFLLNHTQKETAIQTISDRPIPDASAPAYDLHGHRVGANYKGITIVNGKKLIRR